MSPHRCNCSLTSILLVASDSSSLRLHQPAELSSQCGHCLAFLIILLLALRVMRIMLAA